jgi:peptidoglycan hydrolase-like protein with peptidoglycan-binding domain
MDWPDAQSVQSKIDLAKRLGVRGISIFKLDGGQDPGIWKVLDGVKSASASSSGSTGSGSGSVAGAALTRGLDIGSTGEDVRTLQKVLNSDPATLVASAGVGSKGSESTYFGPATAAAVKKFQVKYGIAKPGAAGYGYVGPATRAKINQLLSPL